MYVDPSGHIEVPWTRTGEISMEFSTWKEMTKVTMTPDKEAGTTHVKKEKTITRKPHGAVYIARSDLWLPGWYGEPTPTPKSDGTEKPYVFNLQPTSGLDVGEITSSVLGKVWNCGNTFLGAVLGIMGSGFVDVSIENNALEFRDVELLQLPGMPAGLTIGNTILYASGNPSRYLQLHEKQHTLQGETLGPAYLPAHIFAQIYSRIMTGTYDEANWLEIGPNSNPPRAWE